MPQPVYIRSKHNTSQHAGLCPHCRVNVVRVKSRPNGRRAMRGVVKMEAGGEAIEEASSQHGPNRLQALKKVVKSSLRQLSDRGMNGNILFPIPAHWAKQTGKLSRGAKRKLESYYSTVAKVNALEHEIEQLSDDKLGSKTDEFRERVQQGESLESLLPEAFAVVREAAKRVLDMRHYDCQLVGGIVLHQGQIAEMDTGEGKTLVATLTVYLNALQFSEVHLVTVNEYLAKRDSEWMGKVYNLLGLSVAAIEEAMTIDDKKAAYRANVVYVTAQQLCFDYLGDWSATSEADIVLRELNFAIVDEVDSILLDESRIPMILSAKAAEETEKVELAAKVCYDILERQNYSLINHLGRLIEELQPPSAEKKHKISAADVSKLYEAFSILKQLVEEKHKKQFFSDRETEGLVVFLSAMLEDRTLLSSPEYCKVAMDVLVSFEPKVKNELLAKCDIRRQKVTITERGATLFRGALEMHGELFSGDSNISLWEGCAGRNTSAPWGHYLNNAIKAAEFFRKGTEYIVTNGQVVLIDEATGRTKVKSRYDDGLHQALEAKEKVLEDIYGTVEEDHPVRINADNYTIASVTFQVFFRYYNKLAGMSGTAQVEQAEFFESYGLAVVRIPTHKPPRRMDHSPILFSEPALKIDALICELAKNGVRPVLIGTNSIEESEMILAALKRDYTFGDGQYSLQWDGETRHSAGKLLMLNARPEVAKAESQIIAQAGLPGMITIATKMAGRGTDIVLGGNPRGLVESALYKLVFSAVPQSGGSVLDGYPQVPLPQFMGTDDPVDSLPASLAGNVNASRLRSTSAEESLMSIDDLENVMTGIMHIVERIRLHVMRTLRKKMEKKNLRISNLDFERDIRGTIAEVFGDHEDLLSKESGFRQKLIETALYTWLWFEQQCETYGDTVRDAGGLLVIGMSIAESQRIEDQLRGRAGRQGDPGDSIMFCDFSDPMFKMWSFQGVSQVLRMNEEILGGRLKGHEASMIINALRAIPQQLSSRSRRELREYDEVMEEFRQQVYYLRDIVLRGNHQQRTQLIYSWLQDMADSFVDEFCSVQDKATMWKVLGVRRGEDSRLESETLGECETIEEAIEVVFNPPEDTLALPFSNMRKRITPQLAQAVDMPKEELDGLGLAIEFLPENFTNQTSVNLKMPLTRIIPFTTEMQDDLRSFLHSGKAPLRSAAQHFVGKCGRQTITIELRHALTIHKELLRQQNHEWREGIRGRNRKQLAFLSDYLGELLIMLFEERKLHFTNMLSEEDEQLRVDAQQTTQIRQKSIMLDLLDVYWANFLSCVKRLRSSTSIRAFSRSSPLEEFTIEASREFASMLEQYRKSAVLNLAAPKYNLTPDQSFAMRRELIDSQKEDEKEMAAREEAKGVEMENLNMSDLEDDDSISGIHRNGSEAVNQETNAAG